MTIGKLFTLGYAAPSATCILETLLSKTGTLLVDVRLHPGSHCYPAWRAKALELSFGERYVHVPAFGNVHYRSPEHPIQLADPAAGVRWTMDYEQCHRKLVFDLLTLRLADSLRPPQQMRYESAKVLYQGITSDGERRVSVLPDIFDWNRDLPDEELYDPNGWAREADGEHAWVEQLEVCV